MAKDDEGDDDVPTPVDGGGGAVHVQAVGGADLAKVDEGGADVHVQVDDEDEVAKVVGPNEGQKTKEVTGEEILMTKLE